MGRMCSAEAEDRIKEGSGGPRASRGPLSVLIRPVTPPGNERFIDPAVVRYRPIDDCFATRTGFTSVTCANPLASGGTIVFEFH